MEQRNNKQNSVIFQIEDLLKKMSNQVNFLIRNEEPINQLDLDLMMKNTRKLYDALCSIEIENELDSNEELGMRNEELDSNEELGIRNEELGIEEELDSNISDSQVLSFSVSNISDSNISATPEEDERVDMVWDFAINEELGMRSEELDSNEELGMRNEELGIEEESDSNLSDSQVLSFSDSNISDSNISASQESDEEDSGIRVYRRVNNELQTLGDKLEMTEDISLAARLQRKPVSDLTSAIGINDKFLFLNELFNGSMEKYNKSIRALNGFSTLLGAKTYMSELQIEFQWNCESDAYIKLNDLIERRFI